MSLVATHNHLGVRWGVCYPKWDNETNRTRELVYLNDMGTPLIRLDERWVFREPTPSNFTWTSTQNKLDFANDNGVGVYILQSQNFPTWGQKVLEPPPGAGQHVVGNLDSWQWYNELWFVNMASRLNGVRVAFGNEWDSTWWYNDTPENFVLAFNRFAAAGREYAPNCIIVLGGLRHIMMQILGLVYADVPSMTESENDVTYTKAQVDDFWWNGLYGFDDLKDRLVYVLANADYDEIDVHLYDDPENWSAYIEGLVRFLVDEGIPLKPIICTEFGGPDETRQPTTEADFVTQVHSYVAGLRRSPHVADATFFKLYKGAEGSVLHWASGLFVDNGNGTYTTRDGAWAYRDAIRFAEVVSPSTFVPFQVSNGVGGFEAFEVSDGAGGFDQFEVKE